MDFLSEFDGSGREPRDVQVQALTWLQENWDKSKYFVLSMDTGSGKQAVARAIQKATQARVLVPQNTLIDQALEQYPNINYLIGREHYRCCKFPEMSCQTRYELGHKCTNCTYQRAIAKALEGEETFFNPISYHFFKTRQPNDFNGVIVIDEAHLLVDQLKGLCAERISRRNYKYPESLAPIELIVYFDDLKKKAEKALNYKTGDEKFGFYLRIYEKAARILKILRDRQNELVIYEELGDTGVELVLEPIHTPRKFIDDYLTASKVILLSATIPNKIAERVFGTKEYMKLEALSPIPTTNRLIWYRPPQFTMNYLTPMVEIAGFIKELLEQIPNESTIIHVTYDWSEKLQPYFPEALFNSKTTKKSTIKKFKKNGGVWFAAGCSEGLDLPYDECRNNIILRLPRQNMTALPVRKAIALPGGKEDFDLKTILTFQQQTGRSTRASDDFSRIIVCDRGLTRLVAEHGNQIPDSFLDAIIWDVKKPIT